VCVCVRARVCEYDFQSQSEPLSVRQLRPQIKQTHAKS
jgi:tetrahydromethanopterin S-methyltransferase subunit E